MTAPLAMAIVVEKTVSVSPANLLLGNLFHRQDHRGFVGTCGQRYYFKVTKN